MSSEAKGRRFSKVSTRQITEPDAAQKFVTFHERLALLNDAAQGFLDSKGLPKGPVVWLKKGAAKPMKRRPKAGSAIVQYSIESYLKSKSYAHDSSERLAAKFVWNYHLYKTADSALVRDESLFLMGSLFELINVYLTESSDGAKREKSRKKQGWAIALAKFLTKRYDYFPEALESIPEDGMSLPNFTGEYYRDGEYICYSNADLGDARLKAASFRVGYWSAKQKK